ncbi:MAG: hypothetical protein EA417_21405 [Gammaproteobacteria bacterium]|nr:MAG: hypothetical protein EA417_21405 [Gammaproteobacteria bacterium]
MSYQMLQKVEELRKELLRLSEVFRASRNQPDVAEWLERHERTLEVFSATVKEDPQSIKENLDLAFWLTNIGTFLLEHDLEASMPYFIHGVAVLQEFNSGRSEHPRIAHGLFEAQGALAQALELRGQPADLERAQDLKDHNNRLSRKYEKEFAAIEMV